MFVTSPHFEMDVPRSLLTDDRKCWRTIELSFNGPWFILTYRKREGRTAFDHHLLVWLSADVLQILTLEPAPTVVGLDYGIPSPAIQVAFSAHHRITEAQSLRTRRTCSLPSASRFLPTV